MEEKMERMEAINLIEVMGIDRGSIKSLSWWQITKNDTLECLVAILEAKELFDLIAISFVVFNVCNNDLLEKIFLSRIETIKDISDWRFIYQHSCNFGLIHLRDYADQKISEFEIIKKSKKKKCQTDSLALIFFSKVLLC